MNIVIRKFIFEIIKTLRIQVVTILQIIFVALTLTLILKFCVLDFFIVSSNSMYEAIKKGDKLLISKIYYSIGVPSVYTKNFLFNINFTYKKPKRNDIVVFQSKRFLPDNNYNVKRIVGIPGDRVFQINDISFIGNSFVKTFKIFKDIEFNNFDKSYKIPQKGETIELTKDNINFYQHLIENETNVVSNKNGKIFINNKERTEYTFKYSHYFLKGDNTSNSYDSEYFGLIPFCDIMGTPILIYGTNEKFEIRLLLGE